VAGLKVNFFLVFRGVFGYYVRLAEVVLVQVLQQAWACAGRGAPSGVCDIGAENAGVVI